jgi:hypothetical protein
MLGNPPPIVKLPSPIKPIISPPELVPPDEDYESGAALDQFTPSPPPRLRQRLKTGRKSRKRKSERTSVARTAKRIRDCVESEEEFPLPDSDSDDEIYS